MIKRKLTESERETAIRIMTEMFGRPPTKSVYTEKLLCWQKGREHRTLASLDMQQDDHDQVTIWAWDSYPLEDMQKAVEVSKALTAENIPSRIV